MGNTNASKTENYIEKFYVSIPSVEFKNYLKVEKNQDKIISIELTNLEKYFNMTEAVTNRVVNDTRDARKWKEKLKLSFTTFDSDLKSLNEYLTKINDSKEESNKDAYSQAIGKLNKDFNEIINNLEYPLKENPFFKNSEEREQFSQRFNLFHKEAVKSLKDNMKEILGETIIKIT